MKVLLLVDEADARNGYLNLSTRKLDPAKFPGPGSLVEWSQIDSWVGFADRVCPGEASEVHVCKVLEQVDPAEADKCIAQWVALLGQGGRIHFTGTDLMQVCAAGLDGRLDEKQINVALYGRQACYSAATVATVLESRGLAIERIVIDGLFYGVIAKRTK